jgi:hypothetical protein
MDRRIIIVRPIPTQILPPEAARQIVVARPDDDVRRAVTALHRAVARRVLRGCEG